MTLKNGGVAVEKLLSWSDERHSYKYRFVSGALPVTNHESTIRVMADRAGQGSVITWRGSFEAKGVSAVEAKKIIEEIYESGLASLAGE